RPERFPTLRAAASHESFSTSPNQLQLRSARGWEGGLPPTAWLTLRSCSSNPVFATNPELECRRSPCDIPFSKRETDAINPVCPAYHSRLRCQSSYRAEAKHH